MKLYCHYCSFGFSNCYILGAEDQGANDALIIDPGVMDSQILDYIENRNFNLAGVLISHDHLNHVHGLRTLMRIYNTKIYAVNRFVREYETYHIKDGDNLKIGGFQAEVISIPGHSSDSVVFRIEKMLFTGDVLTAGLAGRTASAYGAALQANTLRSRILSLPGDFTVLPGHGPPSSLEAERRFNADLSRIELNRSRRPAFRLEL